MKQAKFSEIKKRVIPQEGTMTHSENEEKVKIKNVSGIKTGTSGAPVHKRFWEERVKKASELTTIKGRFWERNKWVLEYSRVSPDFAALIFFSEKLIFLARQQVRHLLIHSGSPCHVSQPALFPSLCRWAAQHSASPSPYCTVCTPLCRRFSSLPAVTHTSHNRFGVVMREIRYYRIRISGYYS